jgi:hypothetical protein
LNKRTLLIGAAAIIGFAVCLGAVDGCATPSVTAAPRVGTATATPAALATPAADPTKAAPEGPHKFAIGETGDITMPDGSTGTVTVSNAKVVHGRVQVQIDMTCTTGTLDYNEFDWSYRDPAGVQIDQDYMADLVGQLHSGTLGAGQHVKGYLAFASTTIHGAEITYSSGFQTSAYWAVP